VGLQPYYHPITRVLMASVLACVALGAPLAQAADFHFAPVGGVMSSGYGWRYDPMTKAQRFHSGVDIAAPTGSPVYAPEAGVVAFSGQYGGYGEVVVLQHASGLYTLYGHNSQRMVLAGQAVDRGQLLALVGSTGRATGPHLHFEVRNGNQTINPIEYLTALENTGNTSGLASTQGGVAPSAMTARQAESLPIGGPELPMEGEAPSAYEARPFMPRAQKASSPNKTVELLQGSRRPVIVQF
jgi:hypothetical protein